jgi:fructose-1,6-bisphosphatase I
LKSSTTLDDALESEDTSFRKVISLLAELGLLIGRQIPQHLGMARTRNIYGERQENLDVWANDLIANKLLASGLVSQVGSEELDAPRSAKHGEFSVVFDPIDGSSNLSSNNVLGTIVGVYRDQELPAKGKNLSAAMYFVYGPYLQFVMALKDGARVFTGTTKGNGAARFRSDGQLHEIPKPPIVYGVGGPRDKWTPRVREYVESLEKRRLSFRYGGSLVGDFNQVLTKGGFFAYPELVDAPQGKYRLQFEANPMGFITERAGGKASTGKLSILDVEPESISQRVPTYLGDSGLVQELEALFRTRS